MFFIRTETERAYVSADASVFTMSVGGGGANVTIECPASMKFYEDLEKEITRAKEALAEHGGRLILEAMGSRSEISVRDAREYLYSSSAETQEFLDGDIEISLDPYVRWLSDNSFAGYEWRDGQKILPERYIVKPDGN